MERSGWHNNWFNMLDLDRWEIGDAFGALRATFGQGVAALSARWNIDVPAELGPITPAPPDLEDNGEDDQLRERRGLETVRNSWLANSH